MLHIRVHLVASAAFALVCLPSLSAAAMVYGGGSRTTDCAVAFDIPGANKPAPPQSPKEVDCFDGDSTCDSDGLRNGECVFPIQLCINSEELDGCTPDEVNNISVAHSIDDGSDRRFDVDFQAVQTRAALFGLPSTSDTCAPASSITVRLRGPDSSNVMKKQKKTLQVRSAVRVANGLATDSDKVKFTCRPEGNAVYLPTDLYDGTFDRIRDQVFTQSCALSGCHDSESHQGNLILLAGAAYGNIVGVTPDNSAAANDGLLLITPGDPELSLLYRKLTPPLPPGYGGSMPASGSDVDEELVEIIRLWIIDGAPETGWVDGTDQ